MLRRSSKQDIISNLKDPRVRTIDPHEVARTLIDLQNRSDYNSVRNIELACIQACIQTGCYKSEGEAIEVARQNLYGAAVLADRIKRAGYEASGQLLILDPEEEIPGQIADFVRAAIGYIPVKARKKPRKTRYN